MSTSKAVLVLGLISAPSAQTGASEAVQHAAKSPEDIRRMVMAQVKTAKEKGYDLEIKQLPPDDLSGGLTWLKEKLRSQRWEALIVGNGIRGTPAFTEFFEDVVNASRTIAPETKMGFNTTPGDMLECIERVCGKDD